MRRRELVTMLPLDVKPPFSFARTLEFISRFPAYRDACLLAPGQFTAAVAVGRTAHAFTLREAAPGRVVVELPDATPPRIQRALLARAEHFIGATDDLEPLYSAAAGDEPFSTLLAELHGLHHVRFLTLADTVVYAILMQRAAMPAAAALKRRFLAGLGLPVAHAGHTLRAMPALAALAELDESAIAAAIGHRLKAQRIATAAREIHALGEPFLRTAPYEQARDALLEIDGIGPFAAAAILLRGLGRMDALPWMPQFARAARTIYGREVSESTITRRYGRHIGYWSFYVMTGAGRRALH